MEFENQNLEVQPVIQDTNPQPAVEPAQPEPEIRINPETGEIEIADSFFGIVEPQSTEPAPAPVTPEVKPYTLEEVSATEIDKLDPTRIPAELTPFYKSMLADYTRKTQALSNEKKALEQRVAQMNQPQVPAPQTEVQTQQQPPQKSYYEQLYDMALKNLELPDRLGVPFNEMNPLHLTALSSEVASIQNQLAQQKTHQEQLTNVVSRYTSDPRWGEIQAYADSVLDNLPFSESKSIRTKLASGDLNYIDNFLKTAKEVFYETNGGLKVTQPIVPNINPPAFQAPKPSIQPPVLEGGGVGVQASPTSGFDVNQLGKMTNDQLANLFVAKGFVNQ